LRKIVSLAGQRAGDRAIEPIDLFQAIRDEGGSLGAEILRRAKPHSAAATSTSNKSSISE
jgi:hypothetical protein